MKSANVPPVGKNGKLSTNHQFLLGFTQTGPVFFLPKSRNGPKPGSAKLMNFAISKVLIGGDLRVS